MSFLRSERPGDEARGTATRAAAEEALHDPGAQRVLRLFTGSPRLTRAMDAVGAAVPGSRHGPNPEMLAALEEVVDQSRELSAQVRLVHCQTTNGRAGQQLALHALALAEQAGGYLRAALSSSDPDKTRADLSQGVTLSRESLNTGADAVKLLSK